MTEYPVSVTATSGGKQEAFELNWDDHRWTSAASLEFADFPFIAEIDGRRYELYSDGTFDEEELESASPE